MSNVAINNHILPKTTFTPPDRIYAELPSVGNNRTQVIPKDENKEESSETGLSEAEIVDLGKQLRAGEELNVERKNVKTGSSRELNEVM